MNRISRTVSAVVLSAALLVAVSPAAQARTPREASNSQTRRELVRCGARLAFRPDRRIPPRQSQGHGDKDLYVGPDQRPGWWWRRSDDGFLYRPERPFCALWRRWRRWRFLAATQAHPPVFRHGGIC